MSDRAKKLVKAIQREIVTLEEVLAIDDLTDDDRAAIQKALAS